MSAIAAAIVVIVSFPSFSVLVKLEYFITVITAFLGGSAVIATMGVSKKAGKRLFAPVVLVEQPIVCIVFLETFNMLLNQRLFLFVSAQRHALDCVGSEKCFCLVFLLWCDWLQSVSRKVSSITATASSRQRRR